MRFERIAIAPCHCFFVFLSFVFCTFGFRLQTNKKTKYLFLHAKSDKQSITRCWNMFDIYGESFWRSFECNDLLLRKATHFKYIHSPAYFCHFVESQMYRYLLLLCIIIFYAKYISWIVDDAKKHAVVVVVVNKWNEHPYPSTMAFSARL